MTTWTALAISPDRAAAEALGAALESLEDAPTGVGVFEIEDGSGLWEVGGYFSARPDDIALSLLSAAHGARGFVVSRVEPRDWVAQVRRELSPVYAGRFVVFGAHDADAVPSHLIPLRVEAAMAFGTGHHATTQGCLLALDALALAGEPPRRVADVGAGTGVLGIAAAKLWKVPVVATDIDQVAVETCRANAAANGVAPFLRTARAAGFRCEALRDGPRFDLIFANILARPLARLAPQMAERAAKGGAVVLSGLLDSQAPRIEAVYRGWGFARAHRIRLNGWTTLVLRKG